MSYQNITSFSFDDSFSFIGLKIGFSALAVAEFQATIGPFSADVGMKIEVDNLGEQVEIKFTQL